VISVEFVRFPTSPQAVLVFTRVWVRETRPRWARMADYSPRCALLCWLLLFASWTSVFCGPASRSACPGLPACRVIGLPFGLVSLLVPYHIEGGRPGQSCGGHSYCKLSCDIV
jgi:hypothetical protein